MNLLDKFMKVVRGQMIRYYVYNLESNRNFKVDDILFERTRYYERNIKLLKNKKIDQLTFYGKEEVSKPSVFFAEKPATAVNDLMFLLSLAQSRNIFYTKAKDTKSKDEWGMPLGGKRQPLGHIVILENEIEDYLVTALDKIRRPNFLKGTGFSLALFWWLESIYANRPLETKFISAFVSLETLANSYCYQRGKSSILIDDKFNSLKVSMLKALQEAGGDISPTEKELISNKISSELNRLSVKEKIRSFRDAYRLDFINDELIKDWVNIRNKYMHEGSIRALKKFEEKEQLAERYFQLVNSVQIAILELIGFRNFEQKPHIIKNNIIEPKITIIREAGPFKVTT